jgi:hypothetical protein
MWFSRSGTLSVSILRLFGCSKATVNKEVECESRRWNGAATAGSDTTIMAGCLSREVTELLLPVH